MLAWRPRVPSGRSHTFVVSSCPLFVHLEEFLRECLSLEAWSWLGAKLETGQSWRERLGLLVQGVRRLLSRDGSRRILVWLRWPRWSRDFVSSCPLRS